MEHSGWSPRNPQSSSLQIIERLPNTGKLLLEMEGIE